LSAIWLVDKKEKKSKRKQFIAWMAEVWCIWTSRNKIIYDRVGADFLGSKGYLGAGLLRIMQEDYFTTQNANNSHHIELKFYI
jgi:hypothetical protein